MVNLDDMITMGNEQIGPKSVFVCVILLSTNINGGFKEISQLYKYKTLLNSPQRGFSESITIT